MQVFRLPFDRPAVHREFFAILECPAGGGQVIKVHLNREDNEIMSFGETWVLALFQTWVDRKTTYVNENIYTAI